MLHVPILRNGIPYTSLDVARVAHHRTREPFVEVSQANAGLIRRDLSRQEIARASLNRFSTRDLVEICVQGAEHFVNDTLPLGDASQTPEDYVAQVSATTGMPYVLARRNMAKIKSMFANMESVLNGLTRNIDWEILDRGFGSRSGQSLSFFPRTQSLGAVLPNNSPGVHSLWIPAFPLRIPLVLKPGSAEPWTPYRIIQSLIKAGAPREAFSFYPTDHAGAGEILRSCGRSLLFGDSSTTGMWANDPRVEIHGPGYSKVIIGEDCVDDWEQYLDVMISSIADNGGRSCVNASAIWAPAHVEEIAEDTVHKGLSHRGRRFVLCERRREVGKVEPASDRILVFARTQHGRVPRGVETEGPRLKALLRPTVRLVEADEERVPEVEKVAAAAVRDGRDREVRGAALRERLKARQEVAQGLGQGPQGPRPLLQERRGEFSERPTYLRIMEAMHAQGTSAGGPRPTRYPGPMARWIGDNEP